LPEAEELNWDANFGLIMQTSDWLTDSGLPPTIVLIPDCYVTRM